MHELACGALGNLALFITGVDESQVFLAIVVKPKRSIGDGTDRFGGIERFCLQGPRNLFGFTLGFLGFVLRDIASHPIRRAQRYALACPEACAEFAVIDRVTSEGRFRNAGTLAIALDLLE